MFAAQDVCNEAQWATIVAQAEKSFGRVAQHRRRLGPRSEIEHPAHHPGRAWRSRRSSIGTG